MNPKIISRRKTYKYNPDRFKINNISDSLSKDVKWKMFMFKHKIKRTKLIITKSKAMDYHTRKIVIYPLILNI